MGQFLTIINDYIGEYTTTANGAADGSSLIAAAAGQSADFFKGTTVQILSSPTAALVHQEREVIGYASATGTFHFEAAGPFTAQVPTGTVFAVLRARPSLGNGLVAVTGVADAGSTAALLRDAARTEANDYWNSSMVVMLSGANVGLARWVEDFINATGDLVFQNVFPNAIVAGDLYEILSFNASAAEVDETVGETFQQSIGRKTDAAVLVNGTTASIMAYVKGIIALLGGGGGVVTDNSTGPSNFFAGAISVLSLTPADVSYLDAFYLDVSGFTDGAVLTASIAIKMGAGNAARLVQKQFVKNAANTLFAVIDSPTVLKAVAASIAITVTSNNAADIAVTAPGSYLLR